ncbi:MAG: hypothetical protein OCD01_05215 [Fibrobacterales bacterium]
MNIFKKLPLVLLTVGLLASASYSWYTDVSIRKVGYLGNTFFAEMSQKVNYYTSCKSKELRFDLNTPEGKNAEKLILMAYSLEEKISFNVSGCFSKKPTVKGNIQTVRKYY